ncbi:MAG: oligosaccharide flippase family protein [Candidatus Omnitrophica bacterium]|nr:oligosaccharide flippase family protein [Candidatus Omnitrophota bacterium]
MNTGNANITISQKVVKNTFYNAMGAFFSVILSLVLTPYILNYLGLERFGIWIIVNIFISYLGFFDISIRAPVIKYVSEFHAKEDFLKLSQLINTSFVFYALLALVIGALAFIFSELIVSFFDLPPSLQRQALLVIRLGIASFILIVAFDIFTSILSGLQRMDITNKILIVISFLTAAGTVFVLKKGYGLVGLVINNLILIFIKGILTALFALRNLPQISFSPLKFDKAIFKMLFGFSLKVNVARIAFLVNFHADKVLLGRLININAVSFYELGFKITFTLRRLAFLLVSAIIPAVSEIGATKSRDEIYEFYLRSSKYLILLSMPLFSFAIFNASLILRTWLGQGFSASVLVLQVLCVGYFLNVLTGTATTTALGLGRPDFEMKYSILVAPLNIILSIALIIKMGIIGACIGTAASLFVGALFLIKIFHNYLNKPLGAFFILICKPLMASMGANIFILYLSKLFSNFFSGGIGRLEGLVIILLKAAVFSIIYIVFIFVFRIFDSRDKLFIKQRVPIIGRLLL